MINEIKNSLLEAKTALNKLISNEETLICIKAAAEILINTFENEGRVFSCGNGGSMCDAMHFAEEFTGRYRKNRRGYPAVSINDPSHIACVGNDYGYDYIFSRYLESHGRKGDCLLGISTSGTSRNVIEAEKQAHNHGMKVISMTGKPCSEIENYSDVCICTPGGDFADRVQELHIKVLHILIELVERHFHPELYE